MIIGNFIFNIPQLLLASMFTFIAVVVLNIVCNYYGKPADDENLVRMIKQSAVITLIVMAAFIAFICFVLAFIQYEEPHGINSSAILYSATPVLI